MKRVVLVLVAVLATVLGAVTGSAYAQVQLEREVFKVAAELRCPVCRSENAAQSSSRASIEFRNIIREQLQAGQDRAQILAFFQQKYGDWILLNPPRRGIYLWVWGLPLVAGALGFGTLGYFLMRWRKNAAVPVTLSAEEKERVRRELGGL